MNKRQQLEAKRREINAAIKDLKAKRQDINTQLGDLDIAENDFAAIVGYRPGGIEAILVYDAILDKRRSDGQWEIARFRHYIVDDVKYAAYADDFIFGTDDIDFDGSEEEYGSESLRMTKAHATVTIFDNSDQLKLRRQ